MTAIDIYTEMDDLYRDRYHPPKLGSIKEYAIIILINKNYDRFIYLIEKLSEFSLRELRYYLFNLRNTRAFVYPGADISTYIKGIELVDHRLQQLTEM